jgi:hypothetical protein
MALQGVVDKSGVIDRGGLTTLDDYTLLLGLSM